MSMLLATLGAGLAKQILPGIVGRLKGGKGKVLEQVAEVALEVTGLAPDSDADRVLEALQADPAAYAKVQQQATDIALAEIEAQTRAIEIAAEDRADARDMHQGGTGRTAGLLSASAVFLALLCLAAVVYMALEGIEIPGPMWGMLTVMLGLTGQVFNFHFGSSAGSKNKDKMIRG
ncbi:MAG: hypothetical protein CMM07_25605 [Rhodopirellula sp.]|nr:hypothetical protein [Rhodopirellula sp.]